MNENKCTTLYYGVDNQKKDKPFLQTGEDYEHTKTLNFIRDRLIEVHGESENLDYMHKLNNAIMFVERMEEAKISNNGFEPVAINESKGEKIKGEFVSGDLIDDLFKGFDRITSASCYDDAYDIACEMLDLEVVKEDKPKRTKVEYVNIGFHKCHEAMFEHEMKGALYGLICNEFKKATLTYISNNWESGLYRKVETEMTERDEFIEAAKDLCSDFDDLDAALVMSMFDSGKFKLVD